MNKWIDHVKKYASKKGISYTQALKDPNVKKGYKPTKKVVKGGARYGVPDSPSTPNDDDYVDPRFYARETNSPSPPTEEMSRFTIGDTTTPAPPSRRIIRARRPQRTAPERRPLPVPSTSETPAYFNPTLPATPTTRPQRVLKLVSDRAMELFDFIEELFDENVITQSQAKQFTGEVESILRSKTTSQSEKHDLLTRTLKRLRRMIGEDDAHAF